MSLARKIANELNSPDMLRQLGWLALALGLAVLLLRPVAFPAEPYLWGGDFGTFWAASWLAQHDGLAQLYGTKMLESIPSLTAPAPPWFYPPPMLLLAYPASSLPFLVSYSVFAALSLFLAVVVWKLWKLDKLHLLLLLAAPVTLINVLYGQNGLLIGALWVGGLALMPKRPFIAGCLLGLLVIKPQLAVLAPLILLASRNWRGFAGLVFSSCSLIIVSWFAFGTNLWLDFITNASAVGQLMQSGTVVDTQKIGSLYVAARMAGAGHAEALALHGTLALAALCTCLYLWSKPAISQDYKAAAVLVAVLMITPYQFVYDLTLVLGTIAFWHKAGAWRDFDRISVWLLWLAPLLVQASASLLGLGCLPAILTLALWRIAISSLLARA